ncbi:hypothetical protein L9F63_019397, partial [Diploptera punctata]
SSRLEQRDLPAMQEKKYNMEIVSFSATRFQHQKELFVTIGQSDCHLISCRLVLLLLFNHTIWLRDGLMFPGMVKNRPATSSIRFSTGQGVPLYGRELAREFSGEIQDWAYDVLRFMSGNAFMNVLRYKVNAFMNVLRLMCGMDVLRLMSGLMSGMDVLRLMSGMDVRRLMSGMDVFGKLMSGMDVLRFNVMVWMFFGKVNDVLVMSGMMLSECMVMVVLGECLVQSVRFKGGYDVIWLKSGMDVLWLNQFCLGGCSPEKKQNCWDGFVLVKIVLRCSTVRFKCSRSCTIYLLRKVMSGRISPVKARCDRVQVGFMYDSYRVNVGMDVLRCSPVNIWLDVLRCSTMFSDVLRCSPVRLISGIDVSPVNIWYRCSPIHVLVHACYVDERYGCFPIRFFSEFMSGSCLVHAYYVRCPINAWYGYLLYSSCLIHSWYECSPFSGSFLSNWCLVWTFTDSCLIHVWFIFMSGIDVLRLFYVLWYYCFTVRFNLALMFYAVSVSSLGCSPIRYMSVMDVFRQVSWFMSCLICMVSEFFPYVEDRP